MSKNNNYDKTKTEEIDIDVHEVVDDLLEPDTEKYVEEKIENNTYSTGVVFDCERLNVREKPSRDSNVMCIIKSGDEVKVDGEDSGFYKVTTESGIEGYCMKSFISLKN